MIGIDFFCGIGGLTKGLSLAGVKVLGGIDLDDSCRETYEYNNPGSRFVSADVRELGPAPVQALIGKTNRKREKLLLAGCAPCQPFSNQRRSRSKRPDATILLDFVRFVEVLDPEFVLVENVPGIAKERGTEVFPEFVESLQSFGYSVDWAVLDAKDFGVPQTRLRLVLIASKSCQASLPEPTHGPGRLAYTTVRQKISHFPPLIHGETNFTVPNHTSARLERLNLERLSATPADGGDRRSWPEHLVLDCHKSGHRGHTDVYGRMFWDKPASTLTGRCNSISNGRYAHPEQNRGISLREAAAIQSFPDDYVFFGSSKATAQHIGNAVPVELAKALGLQLRQLASTNP